MMFGFFFAEPSSREDIQQSRHHSSTGVAAQERGRFSLKISMLLTPAPRQAGNQGALSKTSAGPSVCPRHVTSYGHLYWQKDGNKNLQKLPLNHCLAVISHLGVSLICPQKICLSLEVLTSYCFVFFLFCLLFLFCFFGSRKLRQMVQVICSSLVKVATIIECDLRASHGDLLGKNAPKTDMQ